MKLTIDFQGVNRCCFLEGSPFVPKVFTGSSRPQDLVKSFNAVTIPLDLTIPSTLSWKEGIKLARDAIEAGFFIVWKLEMGLFDHLPLPLEDNGQLLSLEFALDHFVKTILPEFEGKTLGVILFEGARDLESLEIDFLQTLLSSLPEGLATFLLFDEIKNYAFLDELEHFFIGVKKNPKGISLFGIDHALSTLGVFSASEEHTHLPSTNYLATVGVLFSEDLVIEELNFPFRFIFERNLTKEWDGLEYLIVLSKSLTYQGKRKLMGFSAAAGTIVTIGNLLNVEGEISFTDFQDVLKRRQPLENSPL